MPLFEYKALDHAGKSSTGVMSADNARDARAKLREDGLLPSEITEAPMRSSGLWSKLPRIFRRKDDSNVAIMTRQFSTLMATGVALTDSLAVLIRQTQDTHLERTLKSVREAVMRGEPFADALAEHPRYFSELYINMVRSGEASGTLDSILERVANYSQTRLRMQNKILTALTYPAVMVFVGVVVIIFLLTFVVPKIEKVLTAQNRNLPLPTQVLLGISEFTRDFWWAILLALVGVYLGYRAIIRLEKGLLWRDRILMKIPLLGTLLQKNAVSTFAHTLSTLLASGIAATDALEIVRRTVQNKALEKSIAQIRDRIIEGSNIAGTLEESDVFPPMVSYMVAVGESTGKLDQVLERLAISYDEEIETSTQKLIALIEPILIVVLALFVGFIALSIVLPIMEMSQIK